MDRERSSKSSNKPVGTPADRAAAAAWQRWTRRQRDEGPTTCFFPTSRASHRAWVLPPVPCFHAAKHAVQHCRGGRPVSRPRESERNVAASARLSIDLAEAQPRRRGAANVGKRRHLRCRKGKKSVRILPVDTAANELEHAFDCCSTRSSTRAFYVAQHSMARPWTSRGRWWTSRPRLSIPAPPTSASPSNTPTHTASQLIQQQRASRTSLIK